MKTAAGGLPPNRLTKRGARSYRACASMQKHLARYRGVDPSQITRELDGERRNVWAPVIEDVRAMAKDPRTDPTPMILHLLEVAAEAEAEAWANRSNEDIWAEWLLRCEAETEAQGRADLPQVRCRTARDREALAKAVDALSAEGVAILRLVSFRATVEASLS